jgi:hypothetical protein
MLRCHENQGNFEKDLKKFKCYIFWDKKIAPDFNRGYRLMGELKVSEFFLNS